VIRLGTVLGVILAYLLGSLPFGFWFARARGINITQVGSGNIGATNVLRALGPRAAIPVLLLDAGKGYFGAWIGYGVSVALGGNPGLGAVLGGLAAFAGHNWSVFLGFRGGKGVAAAMGAALFLLPVPVLVGIGVAVLTVVLTRYVSLGSMLGALSVSLYALVGPFALERKLFALAATAVIIYKHRGNIERLLQGREARFGQRVR
jgi:glycerol-3-phosphate acyltransferase PlsY